MNRLFGICCRSLLLGLGVLPLAVTGCQSTVGGQTLPSANFLEDDIQFFPAGPEFQLSRQVEEIQRYNLEREGYIDSDDGGF